MSNYSDDDYLRLLAKYNDANKRLEAMQDGLQQAEACMSIVEPRSDKAEYLRILGVIRALIPTPPGAQS